MSNLGPSLVNVHEPPPVRQGSKKRPGILVQAMIEIVLEQVGHQSKCKCGGPILKEERRQCHQVLTCMATWRVFAWAQFESGDVCGRRLRRYYYKILKAKKMDKTASAIACDMQTDKTICRQFHCSGSSQEWASAILAQV